MTAGSQGAWMRQPRRTTPGAAPLCFNRSDPLTSVASSNCRNACGSQHSSTPSVVISLALKLMKVSDTSCLVLLSAGR